jgi:hypothetical protein
MKVAVYENKRWGHVVNSFADGVRLFGHNVDVFKADDYAGPTDHDIVVTIEFGVNVRRIHRDQRAQGKVFVSIVDGYLKRIGPNRYYGVVRNGYFVNAEYKPVESAPSDRWNTLGLEIAPWRADGAHVLIADQPVFELISEGGWMNHVLSVLHKITNRPIRYRTHPGHKNPDQWFEKCRRIWLESGGPDEQLTFSPGNLSKLISDLKDAWALVAYHSNSCVEAIVSGVPIFTGARSMADAVANKDLLNIENPSMPDRRRWCNWIAYQQYSERDMVNGFPWKYLVEEWEK